MAGKSKLGVLSVGIGTVLGVSSLALASYDPLWNLLGVARDLRAAQSTGLAILFINAGFLVAVYFQQGDFREDLLSEQATEFSRLICAMPTTGVFSYYTGEGAMEALAVILPTARTACNTRILSRQLSSTSHPGFAPWDTAVRQAVRAGLTFREVVSEGNEAIVRDREGATSGGRGVYEAVVLRNTLPSFLNFIVLESRDGSREVWFGWIVSRGSGFEGTVIRTSEVRIVTLFERWHSELYLAGHPVV